LNDSPCPCPALLIAAPASGQGKTTVTAGLARYHAARGRHVRVFKTGPDFIDPMLLQAASGHPVYQLDLWMVGEAECRRLLHAAACEAELILIEDVMGLFDGKPSSAGLGERFGIPVFAVIDAVTTRSSRRRWERVSKACARTGHRERRSIEPAASRPLISTGTCRPAQKSPSSYCSLKPYLT
jgi:hypothetical protein